APVGFASFDLDYYSSTVDAFALLEADAARLMPRVICYFDDLDWYPWTKFNGEQAAIADFNASHEDRKLSPLPGLRYQLPRTDRLEPWPDRIYVCEVRDHDRFDDFEGVDAGDHSVAD